MRRGYWSQIFDLGCQVHLHVNRCSRVFKMISVRKRRLPIFSHWFQMERSQNWPDLRSPIPKSEINSYSYYQIAILITSINFWKFQCHRSVGVAMTRHSNFFWGKLTWRDLVARPWVTLVWKFHNMYGKRCMNRCAKKKNSDALRRCVWDIREKKKQGVFKHPSAQRGLLNRD